MGADENKYKASNYGNKELISDLDYLNAIIRHSELLTEEAKADILHYALHAAKKAKRQKYWYYALSSVTIALPLISNAIEYCYRSTFCAVDIAGMICSTIVSLSAAALSLFKFRDKWTRYRSYTEELINTVILFLHVHAEEHAEEDISGMLLIKLDKLNRKYQHCWMDERKKDNNLS